jgi:hypothetical protein
VGVELADLLLCEQWLERREFNRQSGFELRSRSGKRFAVHERRAELSLALNRVYEGPDVSQAKSSQSSGRSRRFGVAPHAKRSGNRR